MSKKTLVTSNQTNAVLAMANAKKVTRAQFQAALDDGSMGRFLDGLKLDPKTLTPPDGARLHTVRVKVKLDCPWQEAIDIAGPNTPADYNVRKVADLYPPTGTEEVEEDIILLNFPQGDGNWDKALAWARGAGLKNTVPREVFPIGKQHPKLRTTLGVNPMYVVATTACIFGGNRYACYVWLGGSEREARLHWLSFFDDSGVWFAFRK